MQSINAHRDDLLCFMEVVTEIANRRVRSVRNIVGVTFVLIVNLASSSAALADVLWPACDVIEQTLANADRGEKTAQHDLASCYYIGRGVQQDSVTAAAWYLKSAKQGYAPAQYELSSLYEFGRGVEKSAEQAFIWMKRAAEQGDLHAEVSLATMYALGAGVGKDAVQMVYWTRKAAEQGDAGEQKLLGLLYENGRGVPQDYELARYWYSRAASQRVDLGEAVSAQGYLDALNKRLPAPSATGY